jgi:integrase
MAIYKRRYKDGRSSEDWYVSWYVGGRQFKKKIGPNKRAAELYAKDIDLKRVRGELLGLREEKRILFEDLTKKYLEWATGRKSPHTIADETCTIERLKLRFDGLASKVSRSDLEGYLSQRLLTSGPASYNRQLSLLRCLFKKAVEWSYCRANPADGIRKMKEPPGRVRFLTDTEREKLLGECRGRLRQLVEIALDSGLRKGELLSLKWGDADLKNRMLRIERSKNGDRRDVPMSDRVWEVFQEIPRRLDTPYVFAILDGTPQADLKTAWGKALERSGIENFHFHDLRHTFASTLVMAGVDIRTVQTLLGHRDITMTMRYAHLSPAHLKEAISKLGSSAPRTKQEHAASDASAVTSK